MRHRAFVSSTYEDLRHHRAFVIDALRRSGFDVDPMEDWTADPADPSELSVDRIAECSVVVLLVALRRGYVPRGAARSVTQLEFDAAVAHGIDVLPFVLDEDAPWSRRFDSLDSDSELRVWRSEVMSLKTVGFFSTDPTSIPIHPALTRWLLRNQSTPQDDSLVARQTARLGSHHTLSDLLIDVLRELISATEADYNQVLLVTTDAYQRQLLVVADSAPSRKQRYREATLSGVIGKAVITGSTVYVPDVRAFPGYFQAVPETRSELAVPVVSGACVYGALNVESESAAGFDGAVIADVEALAADFARALPEVGWTAEGHPDEPPHLHFRTGGV